jgi:hypothetical protein
METSRKIDLTIGVIGGFLFVDVPLVAALLLWDLRGWLIFMLKFTWSLS